MILWFGYDASLPLKDQTAFAKLGIRFSWLFLSAVLLFLCAAFIGRFYPLHGRQWSSIKETLAARHEEKQRIFEPEALEKMGEE